MTNDSTDLTVLAGPDNNEMKPTKRWPGRASRLISVFGGHPSRSEDTVRMLAGLTWPFVLVVLATLGAGCSHLSRTTVDYIFSVVGTVKDSSGHPLDGVRVTIQTEAVVYEAIEPVAERMLVTGRDGGFIFQYITHRRGMPYQLTVSKPGYISQELSGAAPPHQTHAIVLVPGGTVGGGGKR